MAQLERGPVEPFDASVDPAGVRDLEEEAAARTQGGPHARELLGRFADVFDDVPGGRDVEALERKIDVLEKALAHIYSEPLNRHPCWDFGGLDTHGVEA